MEGVVINKESGEVTIEINKYFYSKEAVLEASSEFMSDCWVTVNQDDDNFVVALKPKDESVNLEEVAGDFCNFLVAYMRRLSQKDEGVDVGL